MKRLLAVSVLLLLLLCSGVLADTIVLRTGERITGSVAGETSESVIVSTKYGELRIPRSKVLLIEKNHRDEYTKKCEELARRHREIAGWCGENGLEDESRAHDEAAAELEDAYAGDSPASYREVFECVWRTVKERFYDRDDYNGCDWDAMHDKYLERAESAKSDGELYDICNLMLSELDASHCYLWSPYVWKYHVGNEFKGESSLQLGIEILKEDGKYFVRTVYDGGPADEAGVEVGEELVSVNGTPAGESESLVVKDGISTARRALFTVKVREGEDVRLCLKRREGGIAVEIPVRPGRTSMLEAARNSIRIEKRGGKRLGYVHLWHFMNKAVVDIMREAISGKLKDCDGLVLDIRGRGGSPYVIREVLRMFTRGVWTKPSVLVVDEDTSSAKELFAYYWKRSNLGSIVGRTTAGHVLGSGMIPMPDGSVLLLAQHDVTRMTRGVKLEGRGVEPDIEVPESYRYCGGKHPCVEKAFDVLRKEMETGNSSPVITEPVEEKKAA